MWQVRGNRGEKASGRTVGNIPLPYPHSKAESSCPGHCPKEGLEGSKSLKWPQLYSGSLKLVKDSLRDSTPFAPH